MAAPDGLLIVDKPAGWTSHDVVARCRRLAGTRKVGHAGTLDPMATGVLLLGIGRATRLLGHLASSTKAYSATVRLGQSTVTDDAEGEVLATADTSPLGEVEITAALAAYRGDIDQVPSSVSAVKIRGERAYRRVRQGKQVELPARRVHISQLYTLGMVRNGQFADVEISVECSSGTYIRALARDVGANLGVGGHVTRLRRDRVGPFTTDHALGLDDLAGRAPEELPVIELDQVARQFFSSSVVDESQVASVRNGRPLEVRLRRLPSSERVIGVDAEPADLLDVQAEQSGPDGPVAMMSPGGRFLALYEQHGSVARPVAVFDPA